MHSKAFTIGEAQKLDRLASAHLGIPSTVLMENAGRCAAEFIEGISKRIKVQGICIFSGPGNNGGDGFVAARYLWDKGFQVNVFFIAPAHKLQGDALLNYRILRKIRCPIINIKNVTPAVVGVIKKSDVLVDALFGIGLSREIKDPYRSVVIAMNQSKKKILSLDVPSGLHADRGSIWGVSIKAWTTMTFAVAKKGFYQNHGPQFCGKIVVADIGIPKTLERQIKLKKR